MSLDDTCEAREEIRFFNRHNDLIKSLVKRVRFNLTELKLVLLMYHKIVQREDPDAINMSLSQFMKVLHTCFNMPEDTLLERIFVGIGKGVTPYITLEVWATCMSLFLRGTLEEKMAYCFRVYDLQHEGKIRRDHVIALMRTCFIKEREEDADEMVKDFTDVIIKKMDLDHDGAISLDDYTKTVIRTPLLLECFGQCLPDGDSVHAFLLTFTKP